MGGGEGVDERGRHTAVQGDHAHGQLEGLVEEVVGVVHGAGRVQEEANFEPGDGGQDPVDRVRGGQVEREDAHVDLVPLADRRRDLLEQGPVARGEEQVDSARREHLGGASPHTLRRTRHDRPTTVARGERRVRAVGCQGVILRAGVETRSGGTARLGHSRGFAAAGSTTALSEPSR